jgi:hypothetical protein
MLAFAHLYMDEDHQQLVCLNNVTHVMLIRDRTDDKKAKGGEVFFINGESLKLDAGTANQLYVAMRQHSKSSLLTLI